MANVLSKQKREQVLALGRLDWTLRRIEEETGIHGRVVAPLGTIDFWFVAEQRRLYEEDVDLLRLAAELVIDGVVEFEDLRREIVVRFERAAGKDRRFSERRHGVPPV